MEALHQSAADLRLIDLILEPFTQSDALEEALRANRLAGTTIERLAALLPVAIAQLDALDDDAGALALDELYAHLPVTA